MVKDEQVAELRNKILNNPHSPLLQSFLFKKRRCGQFHQEALQRLLSAALFLFSLFYLVSFCPSGFQTLFAQSGETRKQHKTKQNVNYPESAIQQPFKNQLEDLYYISQNMSMHLLWLDSTQDMPHNPTLKNAILWCPPLVSLPAHQRALSSCSSLLLSRKSVCPPEGGVV